MPYLRVNGVKLYYRTYGNGPETIVFSHGLLWSGKMFKEQAAALQDRYRIITYDHRGQGKSQAARSGYDMENVYLDAVELLESLRLGPYHFVGLSMGGFVGMRLAARRPDLLRSLILLETSADPEPRENIGKYRLLNGIVRWLGFWPVIGSVMKIMFGQKFLNDPLRRGLKKKMIKALKENNRSSITKAVRGVITRQGIADELDRITVPTLIMVGDQDVATVPDKARAIHAQIPHSELIIIPGAGHTASVEEPEAVNEAISAFLAKLETVAK